LAAQIGGSQPKEEKSREEGETVRPRLVECGGQRDERFPEIAGHEYRPAGRTSFHRERLWDQILADMAGAGPGKEQKIIM